MAPLATAATAVSAPAPAGPESLIPPDLAAVLHDAPIHPELTGYRAPGRCAQPSAAVLMGAALAIAAAAAGAGAGVHQTADPGALPALPPGAVGLVHDVGPGGVLHLSASDAPRTVSVVHGTLDQRGSTRPRLMPGAVRLVPAGHCVILADLTGQGAVVVEVAARGCSDGSQGAVRAGTQAS
jgi:hypothetical protein